MHEPPSAMKAIAVLTRMALRRRFNRLVTLSTGLKRKTRGKKRRRTATPRKSGARPLLLLVFGVLFLINSGIIAGQFFVILNTNIQITPKTEQQLEEASEGNFKEFFRDPGYMFSAKEGDPESIERQRTAVAAVALMLLALCAALFFGSLGSANQDLGQVDWSLQWLFTFPVAARALFVSKLAEYAVGSIFGWFIFLPLLFVYFLTAGFGFWAAPLALVLSIYIHLILASLQVVLETWMRKRLSRAKLKNFQALFTVLGMLGLFACFWIAMEPGGTQILLSAARRWAGWLPWLPTGLPAALAAGGAAALVAPLLIAACGTVFGVGGVTIAQRLVRNGLITEGGPYAGTRGPRAASRAVASGRFSGIPAKELRLLLRDRNMLVQTLFIPAIIIGFQIVINPQLLDKFRSDFNHASSAAFFMGAYVMIFSAFHVLTMEGKAFWLLFTFPQPIDKIILRKAHLWAVFSAIIPMTILGWAISHVEAARLIPALINAVMVVAGIFIYAQIAAGIGTLATDMFEEVVKRKIRPVMIYLFMMLAGLYVYGLYIEELWTKTAMLVLCSLLAYAIWQKVRDQAPFLLDPTQSPPPRLSLSDGIIAALAFFVLQGLGYLLFTVEAGLEPMPALLLAFAAAGLLVGIFALILFVRRGVPDLFATVGFRLSGAATEPSGNPGSPPGSVPRSPVLRSLVEGLGLGIVALGIGLAYLWIADHIEPLRELKEEMAGEENILLGPASLIMILAVLLAPVFEEFIFRGLIYRGLRRTLRPALAVPFAAAIFAIVHPAFGAIPVFIVGVLTAVSFERTRLLYAPILVHAVYNAGIVAIQI